jgi:cytoskeletal protein RodZ
MIRLEQLLKEKRLEKNLTIEEAAAATKIKPQFLEAIERGAYNDLPSPAYAKGFVSNYADFLGLPKAQISALFKRDFDEKRAFKILPEGMVGKRGFSVRRVNTRKFMIVVVVLMLIAGFFIFQVRTFIFPPPISLSSPKEGSTVSREIEVAGRTDSSATVTINDETVPVNRDGEFTKKITLFPGETTIKIRAVNRSNKETVVVRSVIVR